MESIRIIKNGDDFDQYIARVSVERSETIQHGDIFPHFEGRQYRALGSMQLVDGEDWKKNWRGVDVRLVDVGVVPVEPDGTSVIRFRFSKAMLEPEKKKKGRKR